MQIKRIFIITTISIFMFAILWVGQTTLTSAAELGAEDTAVFDPQPSNRIASLSATNSITEQLALSYTISISSFGPAKATSIAVDQTTGHIFLAIGGAGFVELTANGDLLNNFTILGPVVDNSGLTIEPNTGHLIFVNGLKATNPEPIIEMSTTGNIISETTSPVKEGHGLALDSSSGHLFVSDIGSADPSSHVIRELQLQGGNYVEINSFSLPTILDFADAGLDINPATGNLAVGGELGQSPGIIFDVSKDGSSIQEYLDTGLSMGTSGLAFDDDPFRLYVLDRFGARILVYEMVQSVVYEPSIGLFPEEVCPSWAPIETGSPEEPAIINNRLVISTTQNTDNLWYAQTDITLSYPLIIEGRVRRVSGSSSNSARTPIALGVTTNPDVGNTLYIGQDEIFILDGYLSVGDSATVDTDDGFHDYRIEVDEVGNIRVFYDDTLTLSGTTFTSRATHGSIPRVVWGELSSFASGVSEWERVAHNVTSTQSCLTDVSISKSVSSATVAPNDPIIYTLIYTNNGPDIAYNTIITDLVPNTIINPLVSNSGPLITPTGITSYTWEVAPLALNESGTITITGIVDPNITIDTAISNTAVITNSLDITPTNNIDTAVVQVITPKHVYLPIIIKPAPNPFPIQVGAAIPIEPADQGAIFYTTTLTMPNTMPTTGQFYLSSQPDQMSPIWVDDELAISLNRNELFTHSFAPNCQPVQSDGVTLPRNVIEQLAGESPTFTYKDVCGHHVGASAIWLIWVP